ncbi:metal ABC transporter permease [Ammoniphilus sp. YIM 78166]|uniref:metal ABC transporter permease n=1 Tax=Ammoniphilus sp. YIM 78166 TaxID=1644106 RepID=UPI00106F24CD|nr:metal ABC transporter permease [Ammoniphilus sp. YIM 78166]
MIHALMNFEFMRNALISGVLIGFIAPVLGVFVAVRRMSVIADALSHITLSGVAFSLLLGKHLSFFSGLNPVYLGISFSVAGSLGVEQLRKVYRHYQDMAVPITLSAGIGFGVVFISLANGFNVDLYSYLFGSITAISRSDMFTVLLTAILVLTVVLLFYKELFSLSFDEENAKISGIPSRRVNLIFTVLLALVIASSMRIVGILLVSALIVLPVAASMKIANSFKQTFFYSILFAQSSVLFGLYVSYIWDLAPGGTIVIIALLILCVVISFKKWVLKSV